MALIRTEQSLDRIKELYHQKRTEKMVLTSAFVHPTQKEIIDLISSETGKGKAEVLRDLIDEWVEIKIGSMGSNGSNGR